MSRPRKKRRQHRRRVPAKRSPAATHEDHGTIAVTVFWMVATAATSLTLILIVVGGMYAAFRDDPFADKMILLGTVVAAATGMLSLVSGWLAGRWRRVPAPPAVAYGALIIGLLPILLLLLALLAGIGQS